MREGNEIHQRRVTFRSYIGLSNSYYRPSENELLEDYLKTVDSLTIVKITNKKLEKEIEDLKEKNQNNEYTIKAKLQEKMMPTLLCQIKLWN